MDILLKNFVRNKGYIERLRARTIEKLWSVWIVEKGRGVEQSRVDLAQISLLSANSTLFSLLPPSIQTNP